MAGIYAAWIGERQLNLHIVDSRDGVLYDTKEKKPVPGKALQWRLDPNCPRAIYRKVKRNVSAIRKQGRTRILQQLRDDGVSRSVAHGVRGVEHARAAGIQREHEAVPAVPRVGL
jgi:hypothetical protein